MAALGHSFRTEVERRSEGNPTFLSQHLDALSPGSLEEDEWLENELERARQQRGGFYRKLVNSRQASARELEDLAAGRIRNTSLGSTDREFSGSPSASTASPPPSIPEPHSSWRFYTSYDNGEWKRHCVPVYKPEEEILRKSPTSDVDRSSLSPAYESHLRKYRQARASLFDRPSRRFTSSTSPQGNESTTTVRMVSQGGSGTRSAGSGSPSRLPFGGSAVELRTRVGGTGGGIAVQNVTALPTHYREETTTSESITTVEEPPKRNTTQQTTVNKEIHRDVLRPKHLNLGFKEKIIVPTKYKTDTEKSEPEATKISQPSPAVPILYEKAEKTESKREEKKPTAVTTNSDEPSFLGSTFEKFKFEGVPLVKPTFVDGRRVTKERHLVESTPKVQTVKSKPVFDSPPHTLPVIDIKQGFSTNAEKLVNRTTQGLDTKVKSVVTHTDKRSLPFEPVNGPTKSTDFAFSAGDKESCKSSSIIHQDREQKIQSRDENVNFPVQSNTDRTSRQQDIATVDRAPVTSMKNEETSNSALTKSDGVIFIPVIRVMAPSQEERHRTQLTVDVNTENTKPATISGQILDLDEDTTNLIQGTSSLTSPIKDSFANCRKSSDVVNNGMIEAQNLAGERNDIATYRGDAINNRNDFSSDKFADDLTTKFKPIFAAEPSHREKSIISSSFVNNQMQTPVINESRLSAGEKIIIPTKFKQNVLPGDSKAADVKVEVKNTDSGPPLYSRVQEYSIKQHDPIPQGSPIFGNLQCSEVERFNIPDLKAGRDAISSVSTITREIRSEKPVPTGERRFCSTVEVMPETSIQLKPFDDEDLSTNINITYETTGSNRNGTVVNPGITVKTTGLDDNILQNSQRTERFTSLGPLLGATAGFEGGFQSLTSSALPATISADEDWIVERAIQH